MKAAPVEKPINRTIRALPVVRNFRAVVESRDIERMKPALYQFLNLHCGFIAHFNIDGFKATYRRPRDFAEVFIRHFDPEHHYFSGIFPCHDEPYKETEFTKAHIKREFFEIVAGHKDAITAWTKECERKEKQALFLELKSELGLASLGIRCEACGNEYEVSVTVEGMPFTDFDVVCCLFCGRQIKLCEGGEENVE